jgi:DNA-binding CsgD family transcriptional regulator
MQASTDQLHKFFVDFYAAAAANSLHGLLLATSELLNRPRVGVTVAQRETGKRLEASSVGSPDAKIREYIRHHESKDIIFARAQRMAPNRPVPRNAIVAWAELEKSETYNGFHRSAGIEDLWALAIDEGPVRMLVQIYQNVGEHRIEADEVRALSQLVPHFQTALRLSRSPAGGSRPGMPLTAEALQRTYNLTPSEARVALMLCAGLPTKEIVNQLERRPSSVRSQLKSVFAKTDTHSQVELVHMLLSPPKAP